MVLRHIRASQQPRLPDQLYDIRGQPGARPLPVLKLSI
jgi:hypothetical protein